MTAEPFVFDNSEPTTLKRSDLEQLIQRHGGRKQKAKK